MPAHFQQKHRQRQHQANPKPPCHVDQFAVGAAFRRDDERFQGHAADRARAGADLPDFGVHGASEFRPRGHGFGGLLR